MPTDVQSLLARIEARKRARVSSRTDTRPMPQVQDDDAIDMSSAMIPDAQPQTTNGDESWTKKYGGMAMRGLGAVVGNSGGWWGAAASGASEAAAEKIEGRDINPWQVGFQTALGAVPLGRLIGKGASVLGSAVKSALFSTAGTTGTALAEGHLPTARELETSAVVGGLTGGAVRGFQRALSKEAPAATRAMTAEERVPGTPRVAQPMENEALRMARAEQPAMNFDVKTPEEGSRLAQDAILGAHATAARYSKMSAEMAAREGGRSAVVDRLLNKVKRLEDTNPVAGPEQLAGATQRPMFSPDEMAGVPPPRKSALPPTLDELLHTLTPDSGTTLEHLSPDDTRFALNGSGESAASVEALNRQSSMQTKGEQFVVYDRAGNKRPLIGPDAVDYRVGPGETYGVEGPNGFMKLDDNGGRVPVQPSTPARTMPRALKNLVEEARAGREGRTPYTHAIEDIDPSVSVPTPGAPKPHVPAPVTALWQRLKPKWDEALAAQEGDGIPFKVDPHEDLVSFSERIKNSDPRDLMGAERKARKLIDEGGFITPALALKLGLPIAGGLTGAAVDKKDHLRGALLGAGAGFALSHGGGLAKNAEALRYFSMLSGPATQAKNVVGNVGAVGLHALEETLGGDPAKGGKMLGEMFSSKTLNDLVREFKTPQPGRWGQVNGPLGLPGRAMGAVDAATKDALKRAGLSLDDARKITFTNTPTSDAGKAFVNMFRQGGTVPRLIVPFSQTATNIVERGIERTPILGIIADRVSKGKMSTSVAKQLLGVAAVAGGSQFGKLPPALQAALAPYSVPYQLGVGGRDALDKGKDAGDSAMAAWNEALKLVPAPMDKRAFDPRQWLAQMVPNAFRDLDPVDQTSLDTNSVPFLGPTIAKFPFLNTALLKSKNKGRVARPGVKGRIARSSR